MLIDVIYPGILGDKAPTGNGGKFKAWGYEGSLSWNERTGNVNWHVGGTFTYADNRLIDNGGSGVIQAACAPTARRLSTTFHIRSALLRQKIRTGEEQLLKYKDRYQSSSEIGNIRVLRLGDNMFEDVNKDGKLTAEDLVYLGTDDPKIRILLQLRRRMERLRRERNLQGARTTH